MKKRIFKEQYKIHFGNKMYEVDKALYVVFNKLKSNPYGYNCLYLSIRKHQVLNKIAFSLKTHHPFK